MITRDEYKKLREELRNVAQLLYRLLEAEDLEREEIRLEKEEIGLLRDIRRELKPKQSLSFVKISTGDNKMLGPITFSVGDKPKIVRLVGFDQNGNPMPATFVMPASTFNIDTPAVASSTPAADGVTDSVAPVAKGTANLTGETTSAEGKALSDTETVTVTDFVAVLSSVKLDAA